MGRRAGPAAVPGPADRRRVLDGRRHDGPGHDRAAPRRASDRPGRGVPLRHRRRHRAPRRGRRPDREGAPQARRRRAHRVGADALPGPRRQPRAPHAVHLEPGRLRGRLPVLRHRRARLHARPRRPPRSSTRSATPPAGWPPNGAAADQHRVHGDGRAAAQPRPGARGRRGAQRPGPLRPGGAAHHGVHLRRRPRHPPADRAGTAVHAGGLAPRGARPAARRARAR